MCIFVCTRLSETCSVGQREPGVGFTQPHIDRFALKSTRICITFREAWDSSLVIARDNCPCPVFAATAPLAKEDGTGGRSEWRVLFPLWLAADAAEISLSAE